MENPIKMDDLGVPLFLETPMWSNKARCICLDQVVGCHMGARGVDHPIVRYKTQVKLVGKWGPGVLFEINIWKSISNIIMIKGFDNLIF